MITAKKIEAIVQTGANHVLYREDGKWYHHLKKFPGVLFDINGMLLFRTKEEYKSNKFLKHNTDLNIDIGISNISGYINFDEHVKVKINLLKDNGCLINQADAWILFLNKAKVYESQEEIFVSPMENSRYQVVSTKDDIVKVKRLDVANSYETIGIRKFKTCITRVNNVSFPMGKGSIYEHVAEETAIVELLPMLDWTEDGSQIIYIDGYGNDNYFELGEARNDDVNKRSLAALKIRLGQKKLREKLFYLYSGKCAISGCEVRAVLHACHIDGFANSGNNVSTNAILLRSDIHDLFDANLLVIDPRTTTVIAHHSLYSSAYFMFDGQKIAPRIDGKELDIESLNKRWNLFINKNKNHLLD